MRFRYLIPIILIIIIFFQELIDQAIFNGNWNFPLIPRQAWWRIFTAPLSHAGFPHLFSNAITFIPLSLLVIHKHLIGYFAVWIGVFAWEIPIWLFSSNPMHGLSGVVYGLLGYLLFIGLLERKLLSIMYSTLALAIYGNVLYGLLPLVTSQDISWVAHMGGFIGGISGAILVKE